jgi:hypothetical protein
MSNESALPQRGIRLVAEKFEKNPQVAAARREICFLPSVLRALPISLNDIDRE